MGTTTVAFLARTAAHREIAQKAADYLNAGRLVTATVVDNVDAVAADLFVASARGDVADLHLVDEYGSDWAEGVAAATSLRHGHAAVSVCLVDAEGVGVSGQVGMLRSVGASVAAGWSVLGPLVAMYVSGRGRVLKASPRAAEVTAQLANRYGTMRFVGRVARAAFTVRNWQVGYLDAGIEDLVAGGASGGRVRWQGPTRRSFWADPCICGDNDGTWLFVEDLGRVSGLGAIRAVRTEGPALCEDRVVLSTEHHLSFPQIYRVAGRWLATVETCGTPNPIYTFDHLGDPWRAADDLPAMPPHLADAVVTFDADGQPLSITGTDASIDPDSVFVRWDFQDGSWRRDDTAVFVDVHTARGGGTDDAGRGYRAVQDCAGTYGAAVALVDNEGNQLLRWTGDDVRSVWWQRPRKGVHTLTWTSDGRQVWIDGWLRRVSPVGGLLRLRERSHAAACRG